jgi:hypothetical protein
VPYTRYTTIYTTIHDYVTRMVVSRYRIVTELATRHLVSYYDDAGSLVTVIAYPTSFVKAVNTVLVGVETRVVATSQPTATSHATQDARYPGSRTPPGATPIHLFV